MKYYYLAILLLPALQPGNFYIKTLQPSCIVQPTVFNDLVADDFPVTNTMLDDNKGKVINNKVDTGNEAWFTNQKLEETLMFELHHAHYRKTIYDFYTASVPDAFLKEMRLYTAKGDTLNVKQEAKYLPVLVKAATVIEPSYFTSLKELKLGASKEQALHFYHNPDSVTQPDGYERYEWNFPGDMYYEERSTVGGKPVVKDSFGYKVIMYFKNDKLEGMIMHNAIPQ